MGEDVKGVGMGEVLELEWDEDLRGRGSSKLWFTLVIIWRRKITQGKKRREGKQLKE